METAYYHVNDPLENLRLRITVRETSRVATGAAVSKKEVPFSFDKEVAWQEKLVGPRDVVKRLSKKEANVKDELKNVMLYTYIDKDHFWTESLPPVHDQKVEESYLGAAMFSQTSDDVTTTAHAREIKVQKRVTREKPYKSMHICIATDVDVNALQSKDLFGYSKKVSSHMTEHILCSMRLYGDGLLEVYPNFSHPTTETSGGVSMGVGGAVERASLSTFLDDGTVQAAVNKGFRLMTHRIQSKSGVEYEYCIQNVNDLLSPMDIEEVFLRQKMIDMKAATANRSTSDTATWKQDPPAKGYHKSVALYAEIVSGKDFYGQQLFVNYQVQLPQGWEIRTGNLTDGMAEKDVAEAIAVQTGAGGASGGLSSGSETEIEGQAMATSDLLALDGYADGAQARGMLSGTTHTALARDLRLSSHRDHRPSWRSPFVTFAYPSQGTRFLLGLSFFMITVVAIILGDSFPFWVVPSLGIVFIVGTGYPSGTIQTVLFESMQSVSKASRKGGVGVGTGKGSSGKGSVHHSGMETSTRRRETGPLIYPAVAHFNHLINLSFDVRDMDVALQIQSLNLGAASRAPTIHLQVYSVGWMERYVLEGYGYMTLPDEGGTVDVDIKTWRPQGNIQSKMAEFFLGSAARLKDPLFAEIPHKKATALNRFGLLTESSGSLRIRCHVVKTDARLARVKDVQPIEVTKAINRNRTVEEILNNFRSAGTLPRRSLGSTLLGNNRLAGGSSVLMSTSLEGGIASYIDSSSNPQSQSLQAQRVEAIVAGVRAKALSGGLKALPPITATRSGLGRSSTGALGNVGSDTSSSTSSSLGGGAGGGGGGSRGVDEKTSSNRPSAGGQRRGNSRYAHSSTIREGEEEGSDEEDGTRSDARLLPRK